jgi:hypothetical protein
MLNEEMRRLVGFAPAKENWSRALHEANLTRKELEDFVWEKTASDKKQQDGDRRLLLGGPKTFCLSEMGDAALHIMAQDLGYNGKMESVVDRTSTGSNEQVAFENQSRFAQGVLTQLDDVLAEVKSGIRVGLTAMRDSLRRIAKENKADDRYQLQAIDDMVKDIEKGFDIYVADEHFHRSPSHLRRWAQDKKAEADAAIQSHGWNPAR